MHNLKSNFDKIFPIVKFALKKNKYKRLTIGRPPKFSDAKVISLCLTAQSLGIDSENYLFTKLNCEYKKKFPDLISRAKYNIRIRKLLPVIENVRQFLMKEISSSENVFSVDSMPLEICKLARVSRIKICKENAEALPAKGYCASQKQFYFGYKLHALVGVNGTIRMYDLSPANAHDVKYLSDVQNELTNCYILGDKGYDSQPAQLSLFENNGIRLYSPSRIYKKNILKFPHHFKLLRKRIETTFSQLCDQFMIRRNYAKTFSGFSCRIVSKISAFTLLQFINSTINNKPRNHVKYALA